MGGVEVLRNLIWTGVREGMYDRMIGCTEEKRHWFVTTVANCIFRNGNGIFRMLNFDLYVSSRTCGVPEVFIFDDDERDQDRLKSYFEGISGRFSSSLLWENGVQQLLCKLLGIPSEMAVLNLLPVNGQIEGIIPQSDAVSRPLSRRIEWVDPDKVANGTVWLCTEECGHRWILERKWNHYWAISAYYGLHDCKASVRGMRLSDFIKIAKSSLGL